MQGTQTLQGHGVGLSSSSEELNIHGHTRYHHGVFSNHPAKHLGFSACSRAEPTEIAPGIISPCKVEE